MGNGASLEEQQDARERVGKKMGREGGEGVGWGAGAEKVVVGGLGRAGIDSQASPKCDRQI